MAGFDVRTPKPLTADQARLIRESVQNLNNVTQFMIDHGGMHRHHAEEVLKRSSEYERRMCLVDFLARRGSKEFSAFVDALVATGQLELAKALNPALNLDQKHNSQKGDDPRSSGDGNCIGRGVVLGGDKEGSRAESNESPILEESPSAAAIQQNESYYRVEKQVYVDVPETDGFLSDLKVTLCDTLPPGFDTEKCYPHFSKPKGLALIFNNRRFRRQRTGTFSGPPLPERIGTDVDCKNLNSLLRALGYHVQIKTDLTAQEMLDAMSRFSFKSEHNSCHSAVVVVLTHGTHGKIYGADEQLIEIKTFVSFLNGQHCPALKNKPKVFILQACRGDYYDEGVDGLGLGNDGVDGGGAAGDSSITYMARVAAMRRLAEMDETDAKSIAKTPTDADILIAYATTPGYVSWRNTVRGSWFVQAICQVFAREAHREEILHLFTSVNSMVAQQLSGTGHVQVPEPSSRLTKKFYLLPGL